MKRVLAAFAIIAALLVSPAFAGDNLKTSAQPLATGTSNAALSFDLQANETVMGGEITGLTAAGATLTVEGSTDGRRKDDPNKVWFATVGIPFTCPSPATFTTINADGQFKVDVSGLTNIRIRVSSTGTGTALVSLNAIPAATLGSCGGTGGGSSGGSVNIHDSAGNNLTSTGGALNVTGTFSATLGGFTPSSSGARMAALTVQLTDSSQTLPTGAVTVVDNTDATNPMFCNVNGVAATVADKKIAANSWFAFTIPATITTLHCIATGAPVIANGVGGAGLPTGAGGGGGGSGSFAWPGTAGVATGGTAAAGGTTMPYVNVYLANSLPAGSNSLGTVGLNAGSASIGTVGLNAGANAIGSITNTGFGITGTLPAFAATPTVNLGTIGAAATAANQEVTLAGTSAASAQGVQGVTGGVPMPVQNAPDIATNTAITVQDAGTTCAPTPAPAQSQCTGTPTAGSVASVAVAGQQSAAVVASLTSGSAASANFNSEFSWDGGLTWYGRGFFLDSNAAPIWKNGVGNNVFSGSISVPAGATNYRVRAVTLTGTSPNINIKIILSQSLSGLYVYNLPTATAGVTSNAAVNIQGSTGGLPVITNETQLAGSALSVPTATGVAPAGGALVQNVNAAITGGTVTASLGGFTPSVSSPRMTPLSVLTTDTSGLLPSGAVVVVSNVGSSNLMYCNVNGAAATASDQPITAGGGWFAFTIPGAITTLHCISPAGGTTANGVGGAGLATGTGGGGGGGSSGNVFQANLFDVSTANSPTTTQRIAASGSLTIYLVNYSFEVDQAAATNGTFQIVSGTGSNCASSQVALTPLWTFSGGGGIQEGSVGVLNSTAAGAELCVLTSTTNLVRWRIGAVQQ